MSGAVGIQHCASGLALCSVCVPDRQEEGQIKYNVDFEFVEFSTNLRHASDIVGRTAFYQLYLQKSVILKSFSDDMQLVSAPLVERTGTVC